MPSRISCSGRLSDVDTQTHKRQSTAARHNGTSYFSISPDRASELSANIEIELKAFEVLHFIDDI